MSTLPSLAWTFTNTVLATSPLPSALKENTFTERERFQNAKWLQTQVHAYFSGHEHVNQFHQNGSVASFVCGSVAAPGFYGGKHPDIDLDWMDIEPANTARKGIRPDQPAGFTKTTVTADEMVVEFIRVSCHAAYSMRKAPTDSDVKCHVVKTVIVKRRSGSR
jgi:hypothetical protein